LDDYKVMPTIDWQDYVFKSSYSQSHWLSLKGGTNQTRYNVSGSLFDQDGIVPNSGFSRYQGRISLDQKVGTRLNFNINVNYSRVKNYGLLASQQGGSSNAYSTYFLYQTWAARPFAKEGEDVLNSLFVEEEGLSEES